MSATLPSVLAIIMLAAVSMPEQAYAQDALPNLSGTYRCEADSASCKNSGQTFTLSQSGDKLEVKNEKGEVGAGMVTSKILSEPGPAMEHPGSHPSGQQDHRMVGRHQMAQAAVTGAAGEPAFAVAPAARSTRRGGAEQAAQL